MLNSIFASAAAGIEIKLAVNGSNNFTNFCVQPRWSHDDFLHSASQRLHLVSKAIVAFDGNGDMIEVNEIQNKSVVFVSSTEKFIPPKSAMSTSKRSVGQYFIGGKLGSGGFGDVHLGAHKVTNEKLALKFMPISTLENVQAAERVATEVQALTQLRHPNIIKLMDVIHNSSHIVLAFEFADGGDFLNYLCEQPSCRCTDKQTKGFFRQILSGVSYAHTNNICHRDLKLANLLICDGNQVKIADFGLSAFFRPGSDFKSNCGSLSYLAPEVFRDTSTSGPPLDVWSLGVILFAMLCGRLPFADVSLADGKRTDSEILKKRIVRCQYKVDARLKPDAKDLIKSMLLLNPLERATLPEIFDHCFLERTQKTYKKVAAKVTRKSRAKKQKKAAASSAATSSAAGSKAATSSAATSSAATSSAATSSAAETSAAASSAAAKVSTEAADGANSVKTPSYQINHFSRIRGLPTSPSPMAKKTRSAHKLPSTSSAQKSQPPKPSDDLTDIRTSLQTPEPKHEIIVTLTARNPSFSARSPVLTLEKKLKVSPTGLSLASPPTSPKPLTSDLQSSTSAKLKTPTLLTPEPTPSATGTNCPIITPTPSQFSKPRSAPASLVSPNAASTANRSSSTPGSAETSVSRSRTTTKPTPGSVEASVSRSKTTPNPTTAATNASADTAVEALLKDGKKVRTKSIQKDEAHRLIDKFSS